MISSKSPHGASNLASVERPELRAYCDPVIYKNDKVLKALISREASKLATLGICSSTSGQAEVGPQMRRIVANWMLEVCEEENCPSQVFCLAINYLDRFLAVTNIRRNQLQLVGAVCLLVSLKVRAHKLISAAKIIEFTDFNVTLEDLLEWEFLLLSKLDWDLSAVIAPDYVEHILLRLPCLQSDDLAWNTEATRRNAETLIYMCYSQPSLALYPPSLIATASVLTSLRPVLDRWVSNPPRDTPSPSSCSSPGSTSTHSSSPTPGSKDPMDQVIEAVERLSLAERSLVMECMQKLEELMRASLPPSPSPSPDDLGAPQFTGPCNTPPPSPSTSPSILSTPPLLATPSTSSHTTSTSQQSASTPIEPLLAKSVIKMKSLTSSRIYRESDDELEESKELPNMKPIS